MQTHAFTIALYFLATYQLKNNLSNGKSESTFRNFLNADLTENTVNGEKFERLLWIICSERNAHVLGVKGLNIGKIILDMSQSLEVCRHSNNIFTWPRERGSTMTYHVNNNGFWMTSRGLIKGISCRLARRVYCTHQSAQNVLVNTTIVFPQGNRAFYAFQWRRD